MNNITPEIGENLYWAFCNMLMALVALGFFAVLMVWDATRTERMQTCVVMGMEWDGNCQKEISHE